MIGVFGDSFADDRGEGGWPTKLGVLSSAEVTNHARSGSSIWYSYKRFLEHHHLYDKIIFVYSNYMRWQTLEDPYEFLSAVKESKDIHFITDYKKEAEILIAAHPLLFDPDYNFFMYKHLFLEINNICNKKNIQLINVLPFENKVNRIQLTGTCLTNLVEVSTKEVQNNLELKEYMEKHNDPRICHMSDHNNNVTANVLSKLWNSDTIIDTSEVCEYIYDINRY